MSRFHTMDMFHKLKMYSLLCRLGLYESWETWRFSSDKDIEEYDIICGSSPNKSLGIGGDHSFRIRRL